MSKFILLAVVLIVIVTVFHFCTGPLHMRIEECLPHILIALMAVMVHKLVEVESATYQRIRIRFRRRMQIIVGRARQRLTWTTMQLLRWFRRLL